MQSKYIFFFLSLFTGFQQLNAQLCQGSLGDPVANITFGAGLNNAKPFSYTRYSFVNGDCPNDGFYTLINRTSDCFGSSWHTLTQDHTPGDTDGLMMLVNASYAPGDFYIDTVSNLCPNTTYEFAAWIINILKSSSCGGSGIMPNLTFRIEKVTGELIKEYKSGDIPSTDSPEWKQYGFFFTTSAGENRVVIRLTNNASGGCGNDLALDDITFRPCGSSVNIATAGLNGNSELNYCYGASPAFYQLSATVSAGYTSPALQWQLSTNGGASYTDIPQANTVNYTSNVSATGSYLYRLAVAEGGNISNAACRINSNVVTLNINALPAVKASSNSPVCGSASLNLTATGGASYVWTGPSGFSATEANPVIVNPTQANAGKYVVKATSDKGCVKSDSLVAGIFPPAVASAGSDVTICEGTATTLTGSGGVSYQWLPVTDLSAPLSAQTDASPKDTITYTLTVTDANNCTASDQVTVNVLHKPQANAGPGKVILQGHSVVLEGSASGDNVSYTWSPSDGVLNANTLQPEVAPEHTTTYTLAVTSLNNCGVAYDNVLVRVFEKIIVPNAFSPNGDGINDRWVIEAIQTYPECELQVFNRYGQPVYKAKGYQNTWDGTYNGKSLPVATYYYVLLLDKSLPIMKGSVTILR